MTNEKLTIVICTYNRIICLLDCIASLNLQENVSRSAFHVLVVNNYPDEEIEGQIKRAIDRNSNMSYIREERVGLSYARNTGFRNVNSSWVGFIDDDVVVPKNFVSRALYLIEHFSFDCFGGDIRSFWKYGKPRWLEENFGNKPQLSKTVCEITEDYLWGSNFFVKKAQLELLGGFPEKIGMKGTILGYGAENYVQKKLIEMGYKIGYDPDLIVNHLISPDKLLLKWHLHAAYAEGRDGKAFFPENYTIKGFGKILKRAIFSPIKGLWSLIAEKEYYPENLFLDIFKPWASLYGRLRAIL